MKLNKKNVFAAILIVGAVALMLLIVRGSGPWYATVKMADGSQTLTVFRLDEVYYTITMPESSGTTGTYEMKPGSVHAPGWKETHSDETILPGQWRVAYGNHSMMIFDGIFWLNDKAYKKGCKIDLGVEKSAQ